MYGKYKGSYFGNYLEAVNYADYAFGEFIKQLKQEGLYEDTAILVFGDHNGIVDISVGHSHFLGLKTDGTVISIRISDIGSGAECNVQDWDLY